MHGNLRLKLLSPNKKELRVGRALHAAQALESDRSVKRSDLEPCGMWVRTMKVSWQNVSRIRVPYANGTVL